MNKLSIALCTYNGEKFLAEQLESFAKQTRLPDELVVCDDRSTDTTIEVVNDFAGRAPFPVKLNVNPQNLGSTKNFQKAIVLCEGDLIFLSDQDDVWLPEKIETIEAVFEKNPNAGLVFSDAVLVDETLRTLNESLWDYSFPLRDRKKAVAGEFYRSLLKGNIVTGATSAFRARFVKDFIPIPDRLPNMIHDAWIALVISVYSDVIWVERRLIKYRQHSGQQLGVNWESARGSMRTQFQRAITFLTAQRELLNVLDKTLSDYPALLHETKIESAIGEVGRDVSENITHLENRLRLFDARLGRIPMIFSELKSGRYHRFSRGLLSSLKDILAN